MATPLPSFERVRELLDYDAATGDLRWRIGRRGASAGKIAGSLHKSGYWTIRIDRRATLAHHLVWIFHYGAGSARDIDHRDTNKLNNKIENLREATMSQNLANSKIAKNNTSGKKGVTWDSERKKWLSQLTFQGKNLYLGRFDNVDDAHTAYAAKAAELFGEFARAA